MFLSTLSWLGLAGLYLVIWGWNLHFKHFAFHHQQLLMKLSVKELCKALKGLQMEPCQTWRAFIFTLSHLVL
jgi:hypothetical protein